MDYRDRGAEIRAAAGTIAAISVDSPEKSQTIREVLRLPFRILCDTERKVVREWGIYNPREKGGIARPAVFILDPGGVIRYASVDEVASRIPAFEIARTLRTRDAMPRLQRRKLIPKPHNFFRAMRNSMRFGAREPESGSK